MYTIAKQFTFSASHQLEGLPPEHPCTRLHGHNYTVEVILQAEEINSVGFVVDYNELAPVKELIDRIFDHRHLNDQMGVSPTAEHIARYFYEHLKGKWKELVAVRVSETSKTWAEYRP